jgi:hypothetical protein
MVMNREFLTARSQVQAGPPVAPWRPARLSPLDDIRGIAEAGDEDIVDEDEEDDEEDDDEDDEDLDEEELDEEDEEEEA